VTAPEPLAGSVYGQMSQRLRRTQDRAHDRGEQQVRVVGRHGDGWVEGVNSSVAGPSARSAGTRDTMVV
jgi:hypothetical protein